MFLLKGVDLMKNPEYVAFPSIAFKVGAWIWKENVFIIKSEQRAEKGSQIKNLRIS